MSLIDRVRAALDAGAAPSLPDLQALLVEVNGERCYRRERITYLLRRYLTANSPLMAAPSTTHRFKPGFASERVNIEVDGQTRSVTADTLTDADVPHIQRVGAGHFLEKLDKKGNATPVEPTPAPAVAPATAAVFLPGTPPVETPAAD